MSQVTNFTFMGAKVLEEGSCAAVSATWEVRGGARGAPPPQPKAASGGRPGNPAPSSAARVCVSQNYIWTLQVGPFGAQQCAAGAGSLQLAGLVSAQPLSGSQSKVAKAATSQITLTGCPPPVTPSPIPSVRAAGR
jgi:hypothetical protein